MAYLKVIETSQTWVCPKTADYKIICVAGGQGGGNGGLSNGTVGDDTSFGEYLTATGTGSSGGLGGYQGKGGGGGGGYTLYSYGGSGGHLSNYYKTYGNPTGNGGEASMDGFGFGAGGVGETYEVAGNGGNGGKLMLAIITIEENQKVVCTIGNGGIGASRVSSGVTYTANSGKDGVIVIQEV